MNTISEEKRRKYHVYSETRRNWGSFGQCLSCNRPVVKCPTILEARKTILKETVSPSLICLEVVWLTRLGYDMGHGMIMTWSIFIKISLNFFVPLKFLHNLLKTNQYFFWTRLKLTLAFFYFHLLHSKTLWPNKICFTQSPLEFLVSHWLKGVAFHGSVRGLVSTFCVSHQNFIGVFKNLGRTKKFFSPVRPVQPLYHY